MVLSGSRNGLFVVSEAAAGQAHVYNSLSGTQRFPEFAEEGNTIVGAIA